MVTPELKQEDHPMAAGFFSRNEHNVERVIRIVVGITLLSMVFVGPQTMWGWIGLVPLLTGMAGTCPAYSIFGISTCARD